MMQTSESKRAKFNHGAFTLHQWPEKSHSKDEDGLPHRHCLSAVIARETNPGLFQTSTLESQVVSQARPQQVYSKTGALNENPSQENIADNTETDIPAKGDFLNEPRANATTPNTIINKVSVSTQTDLTIDELNRMESHREDLLLSLDNLDDHRAHLQAEVYTKQREINGNAHRAKLEISRLSQHFVSAVGERDSAKDEAKRATQIVRAANEKRDSAIKEAKFWHGNFKRIADAMSVTLVDYPSPDNVLN
ncbi:hypothetical protein BDP27DRAFT_1450564 [Rhodocollybia butyracea]|uniref:Uncharacterized protein n=1 Tax=Rhodocollybia butyracea TaxID=206335 RepID=A0A9P5PJ61_9AGAR|nr:hypothetical protein BDP27DRAFT_1450564 [Rhodocollybia butyracea]